MEWYILDMIGISELTRNGMYTSIGTKLLTHMSISRQNSHAMHLIFSMDFLASSNRRNGRLQDESKFIRYR